MNIKELRVPFNDPCSIFFILVNSGLVPTHSEARRMIAQRAVLVNDIKVNESFETNFTWPVFNVKVGKRREVNVKIVVEGMGN